MKKIKDIIYEKTIKKQRENIDLAQNAAEKNSAWLITKVSNFLVRFSLDEEIEDILVKIKEDYLFAAMFAKNPGRQNIAELIQKEELKKYCKVEKAPQNKKYINNGELGSEKGTTKSIDAIINDTYCSLKYTKDSGGAQDNQRNDIYNTLDAAKDCPQNFAAIVDGDYWEKLLPSIKDRWVDYDNIWIGTSDEWIKKEKTRSV
jgi:hypothetical protein